MERTGFRKIHLHMDARAFSGSNDDGEAWRPRQRQVPDKLSSEVLKRAAIFSRLTFLVFVCAKSPR